MACPHAPRAALGRATPRAQEGFGVRVDASHDHHAVCCGIKKNTLL
jgi:hypothetical protein